MNFYPRVVTRTAVVHRRCRTHCAGFTDTFRPQRIYRCQRDRMIQPKVGPFRSNWHCIVQQRPRQKLAVIAIDNSLKHCLANPLSNTTMNLALDKHWIDLPSAVINRYKACDLRLSSVLSPPAHPDMLAKQEDT